MNIWILVFAPYEGGVHHQLMFRSEGAAKTTMTKAVEAKTAVHLKDDFGVELIVEPKRCAIILTNAQASAAFTSALTAANREAGATYNLPLAALNKNSTLQ